MDPIIGAALIGGGASLFGSGVNSSLNKTNRDWQERMSNTAHQREVQDMRAAGLNPLLSGTGGSGASTPSNQAPRIEDFGGAAISAAQAAMQKKLNDGNLKVIEKTVDNLTKDIEIKKNNLNVAKDRKGFVGEQRDVWDNIGKALDTITGLMDGSNTHTGPFINGLRSLLGIPSDEKDKTQVAPNKHVNDKPKSKMDWLLPWVKHYEGGKPASPGRNLSTNRGE